MTTSSQPVHEKLLSHYFKQASTIHLTFSKLELIQDHVPQTQKKKKKTKSDEMVSKQPKQEPIYEGTVVE